ncbi:MAG: hypothetical protein UX55_C0039G0001, partial [Candidatus Azambacteria bacterium GW2011_GWE2_46_45]
LRGGGGADSFVQFPLEKGSRKVYNYSTIKKAPKIGAFLMVPRERLELS